MNKSRLFKWISVIAVLALIGAVPLAVLADDDCAADFDLSDCGPDYDPTIDVTQGVENDIDSGVGGNYWAYDDYGRQIRVWEIDESWYAVVQYNGTFQTIEGTSPGATGVVGEGVTGTMQGGYIAYLNAEMLEETGWPLTGYVGSYDYQGDPETGEVPGYVSWPAQYFEDDLVFEYAWWGWEYLPVCESNGSWVNSSDENVGDITGEPDFSCLPPPPAPAQPSAPLGCTVRIHTHVDGLLPPGFMVGVGYDMKPPETAMKEGEVMDFVADGLQGASLYTQSFTGGDGIYAPRTLLRFNGNGYAAGDADVLLRGGNCSGYVWLNVYAPNGAFLGHLALSDDGHPIAKPATQRGPNSALGAVWPADLK